MQLTFGGRFQGYVRLVVDIVLSILLFEDELAITLLCKND